MNKIGVPHHGAVSDSEYANFKSNKENSSRSLPKGTSSLNYGLLVGQIQQKRAQKNRKDGNWSDTNYSTYTEIMSHKIGAQHQTQYGWLQPAQTYSGWTDTRQDMVATFIEIFRCVSQLWLRLKLQRIFPLMTP